MPSAAHVTELLRAFAAQEGEHFLKVALQVAAQEAQRGHVKVAAEMRDLIEKARAHAATPRSHVRALPLAQPKGELAELLTVQYPQQHLAHMVVSEAVQQRLERVLKEQRNHEALSGHGLEPRRKLLLVGPPGTGKTLTASVLATELRLPLFVARFDSLITKFMGESASKLRLVFEALKTTRGVYLFDEFDSLGLQRGSQHDVAEMRRTLNMFLQLIEQDTSESLIVAATNHGASLDSALFRRFDDVIRYDLPDQPHVELLLRNSLSLLAPEGLDFASLSRRGVGLPHSDIVKACADALKDAVLDRRDSIDQMRVELHLQERAAGQGHLL
jgi:SpoVK/Ycf46/Vps4 family AAA+-type ATPase